MKPENFDFLLNSYLKERIPDFDNLLYDASGGSNIFHTGKGSITFAPVSIQCSPTPRATVCQEIFPIVNNQEENYQTFYAQAASFVTDSVDSSRKKNKDFKCIARNLIKIAEEFERNHLNVEETDSSAFANEPPEGLMAEEWSTIRRIHSGSSNFNVSWIATILTGCLTPRTFRGAVSFISERIDNVNFQLALTMELSAQIIQRLGREALSTIHEIIFETFQPRIELDDLRATEGNTPN